MQEIKAEKQADNNVQQADEKSSSNLTKTNKIGFRNKRAFDFNDFRWMLSAMAMIGSFYNSLGYQKHCE